MKVESDARTRATSAESPARGSRFGGDPLWLVGLVGAVLVAALILRFWTRSELWFDEALSVNIARLPIDQIPDALRHDGHPPLYYFLLHEWIRAFGVGNLAVRSLSGVISVATLPLAWFAGRRLGGRPLAWITVLVIGTSPFAFRYATEARMYALVMFLVLGGYLALRRALEVPSIPRLALVAVIVGALELSQYWDFYLIAVVVLGLAYRAWKSTGDDRRAALRVLGACVVGSLLFAPWLGVFFDQIRHTGTPWGDAQFPWVVIPSSLIAFAGSKFDGEAYVLAFLLLILPLLAVFGRGIDKRRIELDLRSHPPVRWEGAAALGTLVLGATVSYVGGTTFAPRYAATMYVLFALAVAFGVTVFLDGRTRFVVLALVVALGITGGLRNVTTDRTQAAEPAAIINANAKPGDVVAYCSDQLGPDVSRLIDVRGLDQVTFPGLHRPFRVNWSDYLDRVNRADPAKFAKRVLDRAGSHTVWFVWSPGLNHLEQTCEGIRTGLDKARVGTIRVYPSTDIEEVRALTEYPAT